MKHPVIRLGTRRSVLATTQSGHIAAMIRALGHEVELVEILSEGDRSQAAGTPLTQIGGTGVFVNALRDALHAGDIDVAVHSLKDLPTTPAAGLDVTAISPREEPRDALVARDGLRLADLPEGARIGTGSPRRAAQLHAAGRGFDVVGIRGNVGTRIQKVLDGELDAVVLAGAGLTRIGRLEEATELLDPELMLSAPGQGALAVECRAGEPLTEELRVLDHALTRACVEAERSVLATLEGGCAAPIGVLAQPVPAEDGAEKTDEQVWVRAVALAHDGSRQVRDSVTGRVQDAVALATRMAERMLDAGAKELTDGYDTGGAPGTGSGRHRDDSAPEQNKVR